jgi:hypothetical protein
MSKYGNDLSLTVTGLAWSPGFRKREKRFTLEEKAQKEKDGVDSRTLQPSIHPDKGCNSGWQ